MRVVKFELENGRIYEATETGRPFNDRDGSDGRLTSGGIHVVRLDDYRSYVDNFCDWETVRQFVLLIARKQPIKITNS